MLYVEDRFTLGSERVYSDEGFLMVPARISRSGIQDYYAVEMGLTDREPKDIVKVYRPEEEVFSDEALSSFANKPVTDNHPPELLSADNAKRYSVGHVGPDITKDGIFARAMIHINDAEAIKKVESGKVELSNGYTAEIEWTKGMAPDGQQYDAIQRNIKGNHVAVVDRGRAGPACRVADNLSITEVKTTMTTILIDGISCEVTEQTAQAVGKLQTRLDAAEEEAAKSEEEKKKKEDELEEEKKKASENEDSLQAKLDDALTKIPTGKALDDMLDARKVLVDSVLLLYPDAEWMGKDQKTLIKDAVSHVCPDVDLTDKSAEYIQARFDLLLDAIKDASGNSSINDAIAASIKGKTKGKNDEKDTRPLSLVARDKMIGRSQQAWKGEK